MGICLRGDSRSGEGFQRVHQPGHCVEGTEGGEEISDCHVEKKDGVCLEWTRRTGENETEEENVEKETERAWN